MLSPIIAVILMSSTASAPADKTWNCTNQIEVWCTVDSCAAKNADEATPLSIQVKRNGEFSVCAYTGCWEGVAAFSDTNGRLVWAADDAPFSTQPGAGFNADVSVLIVKKDAVGFVRVGGLATPLLCLPAGTLSAIKE